MTRGDEDIEEGLRRFLNTRKGGSEKIRGRGLQKIVSQGKGAAKISSFEFQYLYPPPPPCHIK